MSFMVLPWNVPTPAFAALNRAARALIAISAPVGGPATLRRRGAGDGRNDKNRKGRDENKLGPHGSAPEWRGGVVTQTVTRRNRELILTNCLDRTQQSRRRFNSSIAEARKPPASGAYRR